MSSSEMAVALELAAIFEFFASLMMDRDTAIFQVP
jgi:hypothetical protein